MQNAKISIIIPMYNSEEYISQCLKSVVSQTYKNIEILVVNDGSKDKSLEIVDQFAKNDSRIKVITQKNQGLSSARNTGLKYKTGEYVLFLDSDDWIDKETCENTLNTLNETDSDVVMWAYTREYSNKSKVSKYFGEDPITWKSGEQKLIHRRMIGPVNGELKTPQNLDSMVTAWGKLYKSSILDGIEFIDTKIIGTEDALYNVYVFKKVNVVTYLPNTFSHYRKNNTTSLTHSYKEKLPLQWREMYRMMQVFLDDIKASDIYYEALDNRICLGIIGLGLNIIEDNSISIEQKKEALKKILDMPHYENALTKLKLKYLPKHWKVFFLCAKQKNIYSLLILLKIMNLLRGR